MTTTPGSRAIHQRITEELGVKESQVAATAALLDEGATVPFVARYRKEVTGGLDDAQLRTLDERLSYLRELEKRRAAVLESIRGQGKLTDELAAQVMAAETRARLEDIYLPYKPKRRTKAQIAREAGLEPLADLLFTAPDTDPRTAAEVYVDADKNVADAAAALQGARAILTERFAEDADLVGELRERMWSQGRLVSRVKDGEEEKGAKFADYFDFAEAFTDLPPHRVLALLRGEKEEVLQLTFAPDDGSDAAPVGELNSYEQAVAQRFGIVDQGRAADTWLVDTVRWAWKTRLQVGLKVDVHSRLRQAAEDGAVSVFASNLRDLLLAAPAGTRATLGLDPGLRTGVKVAVVDGTGKAVATDTIYPHAPQRRWDDALATLAGLVVEHDVELIAVGNGTASRETDKLAGDLIKLVAGGSSGSSGSNRELVKTMVSEAGASVYSASAYASKELPDMDVSLRGAVSIARRLQDPLAELVKIEPRSIGVGQYQHDVSEYKLSRSLDAVVEDCVNGVGVDVNTASAPLLARVAGVSSSVAENIVAYRDVNGSFRSRSQLTAVPRLGPATFEQCAGFLRIREGDDQLDASGVHPESYPVVRRMADAAGGDVAGLVGNSKALRSLKATDFTDETVGLPTVRDILTELEKPGRDPRPAFETAEFREGVETLEDLEDGMILQGVVSNVAAFGAFVDVGVHQDGLVHVSAMSHNFVSDPRDVVKPGDVVRVKVLSVDVARKRISLTLRLDDEPGETGGDRAPGGRSRDKGGGGGGRRGGQQSGGGSAGGRGGAGSGKGKGKGGGRGGRDTGGDTAMADAFRRSGL